MSGQQLMNIESGVNSHCDVTFGWESTLEFRAAGKGLDLLTA
jgi:hypothetical protein